MLQVLCEFPGLPHRMQFVRRLSGVNYVNDSKATNVAAAVASIESIDGMLVLIAGGEGKGGDFSELAQAVEGKLRAAVLIGADAEKIAAALDTVMPVHFAADMRAAVNMAASCAESGDTVLLAPACVTGGSSFGIWVSGLLGDHLGWRSSFLVPPVMMAAVALVFWILVRDHPRDKGLPDFDDEIDLERQIAGDPRSPLMVVLSNRILWTVALVYFCFCYVQFGCLVWIPTFLKEGYAMTVDRAGTISAIILLPGALASPIAGVLSDHYFNGRRKPLIILGMIVLSGSTLTLFCGVELIFAF